MLPGPPAQPTEPTPHHPVCCGGHAAHLPPRPAHACPCRCDLAPLPWHQPARHRSLYHFVLCAWPLPAAAPAVGVHADDPYTRLHSVATHSRLVLGAARPQAPRAASHGRSDGGASGLAPPPPLRRDSGCTNVSRPAAAAARSGASSQSAKQFSNRLPEACGSRGVAGFLGEGRRPPPGRGRDFNYLESTTAPHLTSSSWQVSQSVPVVSVNRRRSSSLEN